MRERFRLGSSTLRSMTNKFLLQFNSNASFEEVLKAVSVVEFELSLLGTLVSSLTTIST